MKSFSDFSQIECGQPKKLLNLNGVIEQQKYAQKNVGYSKSHHLNHQKLQQHHFPQNKILLYPENQIYSEFPSMNGW